MTKMDNAKHTGSGESKKLWEPLKKSYAGRVADVVQGGGGKLSIAGGDPGEGRKQVGGDA
ncbi:MAG: hypothetical protein ABJC63_01890 [Gemmatimonadales bacterium]